MAHMEIPLSRVHRPGDVFAGRVRWVDYCCSVDVHPSMWMMIRTSETLRPKNPSHVRARADAQLRNKPCRRTFSVFRNELYDCQEITHKIRRVRQLERCNDRSLR